MAVIKTSQEPTPATPCVQMTSHLFPVGMGRDHNAMGGRKDTKIPVDERNYTFTA